MAKITVQELMAESGVAFGTSGARGEVAAMTDRVCYGYTCGFLAYLAEPGDFAPDGRVALAGDLRPSTPRILAACARAIGDSGGVPVFCGYVPTPALALYAFAHTLPSLMVTGSHIPADRNGIKFYRPASEMLKHDEPGMGRQVIDLRADTFASNGDLTLPELLPQVTDVEDAYVARYVAHFGAGALTGKRIGVYQHSAVGCDVLVRIVRELGAEVESLGRSDTFIPVDNEAIRPAAIRTMMPDARIALTTWYDQPLGCLCGAAFKATTRACVRIRSTTAPCSPASHRGAGCSKHVDRAFSDHAGS